jgi:hypothetical protein
MIRPSLLFTGLLLVFVAACSRPADAPEATSPYAGEETRTIKALSEQDIDGYLSGEGMGLARAAELNHYPGPRHVLALADELALTADQREAAQRVFEEMQAEAITLGKRIVEQEGMLDGVFAEGRANAGVVRNEVRAIAELQGHLRFVHLNAHLAMKDVLTDEQVQRYDQLRGYDASAPPGQHLQHEMNH